MQVREGDNYVTRMTRSMAAKPEEHDIDIQPLADTLRMPPQDNCILMAPQDNRLLMAPRDERLHMAPRDERLLMAPQDERLRRPRYERHIDLTLEMSPPAESRGRSRDPSISPEEQAVQRRRIMLDAISRRLPVSGQNDERNLAGASGAGSFHGPAAGAYALGGGSASDSRNARGMSRLSERAESLPRATPMALGRGDGGGFFPDDQGGGHSNGGGGGAFFPVDHGGGGPLDGGGGGALFPVDHGGPLDGGGGFIPDRMGDQQSYAAHDQVRGRSSSRDPPIDDRFPHPLSSFS